MSGRGKLQIRNPADAVAMAKCWLSKWTRGESFPGMPDVNSFHPTKCEWCDYPRDVLIRTLEEFGDWAHLFEEEAEMRMEVESFLALPGDEQSRLVRKSQGYDAGVQREKRINAWWGDNVAEHADTEG